MSDRTFPEAPTWSDEEYSQFFEWLNVGKSRGYISETFCNTHDGYPMPDWEEQEWDDGHDPCCFAVRLYGPYYPYGPDSEAEGN